MPHGRLPRPQTPYPRYVVTTGERDLRRAAPMNVEPRRDEGARAGEGQGSCAEAPGGRADGGE